VNDRMDAGLGGSFWLKFVGVLLLGAIGAILVFLLIANAWAKWGLFGGILFFGAVLLAIAWVGDRRSQRRYDALEG
jgi:phosphatidylglycerophosphate synthase